MPEGDTIRYAAGRIRPVLVGKVPDDLAFPHPRFSDGRFAETLAGRVVEAVEARGKHLFILFAGDLVLHSHLRMTGAWRVGRADGAIRPQGRVWFQARAGEHRVLQLGGPVLEILPSLRLRTDPRFSRLGPDILDEGGFDESAFVTRLRAGDQHRSIGEALLDQQVVAGIGNIWKSEGCFEAGIDPWRDVRLVPDEAALSIVRAVRPRMQLSAEHGFRARDVNVYRRSRRPCPRCGAGILSRGQGDENRLTYWCAVCQT